MGITEAAATISGMTVLAASHRLRNAVVVVRIVAVDNVAQNNAAQASIPGVASKPARCARTGDGSTWHRRHPMASPRRDHLRRWREPPKAYDTLSMTRAL